MGSPREAPNGFALLGFSQFSCSKFPSEPSKIDPGTSGERLPQSCLEARLHVPNYGQNTSWEDSFFRLQYMHPTRWVVYSGVCQENRRNIVGGV